MNKTDDKIVASASVEHLRQQLRLSARPNPAGWQSGADAGDRGGVGDETDGNSVKLRSQRMLPGKAGKLLRYALTLKNLLTRRKIVKDFPLHLQLESTDACNLHCTSCSRDVFVDKPKLLDAKIWKKVIDDMVPTNINVSGIGEPFLHPDIFEIVKYAKSRGCAVNCATNFTRIKGRHREIVESGISQMKISIDATDAATYQAIRGDDAFDHIVENIHEVNRWKRELGSSMPSLRFNFAVQRLNFLQAPRLVELAAELGIDGIYFQYLEYVDMEDRKEMLTADMTRERLRETLEEADRRAAELGIITNLHIWWKDFDIFWNKMQPVDKFEPNDKACYFPWFSTWVGADGWVRPCPIMPWTLDEGRMGNLKDQSFEEIWNGPQYRKLRGALARGERPTRSCKTCIPQSLGNILFLKTKLLPDK